MQLASRCFAYKVQSKNGVMLDPKSVGIPGKIFLQNKMILQKKETVSQCYKFCRGEPHYKYISLTLDLAKQAEKRRALAAASD